LVGNGHISLGATSPDSYVGQISFSVRGAP
jgi:hypothetical protein